MAPAKKVTGILSCDPSWRGLAFILYIPSLEYKESYLYDLKNLDSSKQYKHPKRTIRIVNQAIDELFQDERIQLVDKLIIEGQHRNNMQVLSYIIISNLSARLNNLDVEYISPLAWKRNFNIALTGTHQGNKDAAEEFVENSKSSLTASETVVDDNTADACLLLNSYLKTTKNRILKNLDDWSSMSLAEVGTKLYCIKCGNKSAVVRKCEDKSKKLFGKHFITCWWTNNRGTDEEKKCGSFKQLYANIPKIENGYVDKVWKVVDGEADNDEVVEIPKVGVKRAAPSYPNKAPPAKFVKNEAPMPPSIGNAGLTKQDFITVIKKAVESIKGEITQSGQVHYGGVYTRMDLLTVQMEQMKRDITYLRNMMDSIQNPDGTTSDDKDQETKDEAEENTEEIVPEKENLSQKKYPRIEIPDMDEDVEKIEF